MQRGSRTIRIQRSMVSTMTRPLASYFRPVSCKLQISESCRERVPSRSARHSAGGMDHLRAHVPWGTSRLLSEAFKNAPNLRICCQGLAGLPGGNAVGSASKKGPSSGVFWFGIQWMLRGSLLGLADCVSMMLESHVDACVIT